MTTVLQLIAKSLFANSSDEERARIDAAAQQFAKQVTDIATVIGQAIHAVARGIENRAREAERAFERAQLLEIYRKRRSWKKGDLPKLRTHRLSRSAQKRLATLQRSKQFGRPTIRPRRTLAQQMAATCEYLQAIADPSTPPTERLRLLKRTEWWGPVVEAAYRGEYERLRSQKFKRQRGQSVSSVAEHAVALAFLISVAELKRLRNKVRKDPVFAIAREAPLTVAEIEDWKNTGSFPSSQVESNR